VGLNKAQEGEMAMAWAWQLQVMCTSLQTDNHTDTSSLNSDRPNAVSDVKALRAN